MNITIASTYEDLSEAASLQLIQLVKDKSSPLICVPSGDSPVGLYKKLVQKHQSKELDTSRWHFVSLDEWMGMNQKDEGSCTYYLHQQVVAPLGVDANRMFFFDGRRDPIAQCNEMETFISTHGGIDVAILGLGLNGHIGMNEPGTSASVRTHISDIDPQTQQVGQKYFKEATSLSQGLTLGLATLLEAKNIMLIVSGEKKAAIVKQVLEDTISESVPASLLRNHPSVFLYLDEGAAKLINPSAAYE